MICYSCSICGGLCTLWLRCILLCFWISLLLRHTIILQLFWCNLKNVQLLNTLYFMSKSWCDYGLNFRFFSFSVLSFEFHVSATMNLFLTPCPVLGADKEKATSVWHRYYFFVTCTLSFATLKTVFWDFWLLLCAPLIERFLRWYNDDQK